MVLVASDKGATPKLQQLYQEQYHVSNLNVEFCKCGKDNVLYIYMLCVSIRVLNISLICAHVQGCTCVLVHLCACGLVCQAEN